MLASILFGLAVGGIYTLVFIHLELRHEKKMAAMLDFVLENESDDTRRWYD